MEVIKQSTLKRLAIGWAKFFLAFVIVAGLSALAGHEAEQKRQGYVPAPISVTSK